MVSRRSFLLAVSFLMLTGAVFAQVGTIEGTVLLPAPGGPAVGATVTLFMMHHDSITTATDSAGHFRFDSVAAGFYDARATLAGYLPGMGDVRVMAGHTAHLNLMLHSLPTGIGRVAGVVLLPNHGGPAVGATVILFRARGDSLTTVSDDSGRFVFDSARVGMHDIYATLTGYLNAHGDVLVRDGQLSHVVLMLRSIPVITYGSVAGTVIFAADSTPVAAASVVLRGMHHDSVFTTTDREGHFAFDSVQTGEYRIRATLTGYMPADREVNVRNGQTTQVTLALRVMPTAVVQGLVTLLDQTPVAGAFVDLDGPNHRDAGHMYSDSLGHFTFNHVPAGHYVISAAARMHGFARQEFDVADGQTVTLTLVLNDSTHGGRPSLDEADGVPVKQFAANNYPNPFNPTTTISYSVPMAGTVRLSVYDVLGRKVADLVNDYKDAGSYNVSFNGENLPSGLYFYKVSAGNVTHTGRMMLLK